MTKLADVIAFLENGDWEAAHPIAQDDPSSLGSWAHGIVHMMEGDLANAGHWYKRAERKLPEVSQINDEIAELKQQLGDIP